MDFSYLDDLMEEATGPAIEEGGEGYRNIWAVAEVAGDLLHPATPEVMAQARELADQIGTYVYGIVLGSRLDTVAQELIPLGADKVLAAEDPACEEYQPEVYVRALADLVARYRPEMLLMSATALGNDLAPRLAQRLNTGLASHCVKLQLDMSERLLLATFAVLGGEVYHTVACPLARPQMATLEPGAFATPAPNPYRSGDVQKVEIDAGSTSATLSWLGTDERLEAGPVPLTRARIVVSAGRGMGDASGFALVEKLAQALGAALAGSRGALDAGWISEDRVVGAGGVTISPDLYLACGISGDIYHYIGLQSAKFVVAINPDPDAPIMKVANMSLVGDARQIIPAILKRLDH